MEVISFLYTQIECTKGFCMLQFLNSCYLLDSYKKFLFILYKPVTKIGKIVWAVGKLYDFYFKFIFYKY